MTVEGDATARLLPFPSVTFSDVRVAGAGDEPAMTVETFSMDAELAPFLSGHVLIFDMRLVRPKALITVSEDGAIDWTVRPSTPVDPHNIRLEKLTVTEGAVAIRHGPSGRTHMLTEVNADIAARTLAGPWRLAGSMRLDGMLTDIEASTGAVDETGAMRLRVRAKPHRYPLSVEIDGDAAIRDRAGRYDGSFRIAAFDAEPKKPAQGAAPAAAAPADYRLAGRFTLDHRRLAVEEFRFETGPVDDPYTADGTAEIEIGGSPRFQVTATGAQFRFDESVAEGEETAALTLGERVTVLKRFVAALPKPAIPGRIDVRLPALVAGDTTFRDVRLSAEPAEGGWRVGEFAASLPGRTTLEARGTVATADEDARFSGEMLLAVGQPSGFAAWLARDVDEAIRRLPAAGFSAKVELSSERQVFSDLELALGAAKFGGHVEHLTPADAKPALLAELNGGELEVEGLMAFASLFVSDAGASRFADRDLDLKLTAGPVNLAGLTAAKVDTALRLKEGQLDIDRLSVSDLAGANVSATGAISGFPANPAGNLDASILAGDLAPLVALLGERFPDNGLAAGLAKRFAAYPGLGEDTHVELVATSAREDDRERFALSASGRAGGSAFSLAYSGDGTPLDPATVDLDYAARNEDAEPILALYGLPALPLPVAGPARTELTVTGAPGEGMSTSFRLHGETAEATFDGTVKPAGGAYTAEGKASVVGEDVAPWLTAMGVALPGLELGLEAALTSDLSFSGGKLALPSLAGTLAGSTVSGDLTATLKEGTPHVEGALTTAWLPFDLAAALVLGEAPLAPDGDAWPQMPFPARTSLPFTADLSVKAGAVAIPGRTLATDASFKAKLDREGLAVSDLAASTLGGRLTGLFEVRNNEGTGLLTVQASLADADLSALPGADALAGKGDLTTSLNASGKSVGGMVTSLSGTGTARLDELVIDGLNANAVPALIAGADRIGRDIDAAAVEAFAPGIAREGRFVAAPVELAYTVAGGVVRAAPFTLASQGASAMVEFRADLGEWTLGVDGEMTYDPGQEALVGSEPAFRFSLAGAPGEAAMSLDMQPMAQFLTQRALEIEQARVEAMQAALLEKQRLRREVRYYAALQDERERIEAERLRAEEEARVKAEEEARIRAEEEARRQAEEQARAAAEAEAQAKAEAEAKAKADAEAKAKAEAEARAAEEARRKADEEAKRRVEEEARKKAAPQQQPAANQGAREAQDDDLPDMAGRRAPAPAQQNLPVPQDRPVPQVDVGPQRPAPQGGFSLDNLLRALGGGSD